MRLSLRAVIGVLLPLLLPACQGIGEMQALLQDLQTLQQGLGREFGERAINVNVTGDRLTILFVNSTIADLPGERRAALARQVAEYARDHYPRYGGLRAIAVGVQRSVGVGVKYVTTEVPYLFDTILLGPAPGDSAAAGDSAGAGS